MEKSLPRRSPGTDRFLSLLSRPGTSPPAAANGSGGVELQEEEVFWTSSNSSDPVGSMEPAASAFQSPLLSSVRAPGRRISDRNSGILAALAGGGVAGGFDASLGPLLQRKASISASASTSPSSSSAARLIPVIPKPKADYAPAAPYGKVYHQSAPVNVPMMPRRATRGPEMSALSDGGDDEEEMLPPHEAIARRSGASPMTTFSVLEGAGRTLKGRDLRRVRNAVWRQTGFLD